VEELLKLIAAGGDLGTLGVVFVYMKLSGQLAELRGKIGFIERALGIK